MAAKVAGDCTDTYTTTDEWGGQRTFSADGTFLSYFREMRMVLHETPEEREEFLRMAQVVQQLRFSRAPTSVAAVTEPPAEPTADSEAPSVMHNPVLDGERGA